jgi:ribosomal protein S24E
MEILNEIYNSLLKRKELVAKENYESNPGFEKTMSDIAKKFKVENETVVIRRINSSFGTGEFVIEAFIYESVKDKEKIEPKKKEKKK